MEALDAGQGPNHMQDRSIEYWIAFFQFSLITSLIVSYY